VRPIPKTRPPLGTPPRSIAPQLSLRRIPRRYRSVLRRAEERDRICETNPSGPDDAGGQAAVAAHGVGGNPGQTTVPCYREATAPLQLPRGMPRHARIVASGYPMHVSLRDIDRGATFFAETDRRLFLAALAKLAAAESVGVGVRRGPGSCLFASGGTGYGPERDGRMPRPACQGWSATCGAARRAGHWARPLLGGVRLRPRSILFGQVRDCANRYP
jgi:hypothetical protein